MCFDPFSSLSFDNLLTILFSKSLTYLTPFWNYSYILLPSSVIGVHCVDGVIIAVEKPIISKLLKSEANKRVLPLDTYSAMAVAGIQPDGRALANSARDECRQFLEFYGSHIPGAELVNRISGRLHKTTIYWQERPFGCAAIISTYDLFEKYGLYTVGPSGVLSKRKACCVGRHKQTAKTELEKINFSTITVADAAKVIAMIYYKLHDDVKEKEFEIEMVWQCDASEGKVQVVPADVRSVAVSEALEAKQRSLMEDSDEED